MKVAMEVRDGSDVPGATGRRDLWTLAPNSDDVDTVSERPELGGLKACHAAQMRGRDWY